MKSSRSPRAAVAAAAATLGASLALSSPAAAFEFMRGEWTVTIGVQGVAVPVFEGSDVMRLRPMPIFSVRRAGTRADWRAPDDSIRLGVLEHDRLRVGIAGRLRPARDEDDNRRLRGLGDVGWTPEIGVYAEVWASDALRFSGELRQGIGGHSGLLLDLGADFVARPESAWTLSVGPRASFASKNYMDAYFGVDQFQSVASGLPTYEPEGGLRSLGLVASAQVRVSPSWTLSAYARYDRLMGEIADAPLVRFRGSPNQFGVGAGISYSFDVAPFR